MRRGRRWKISGNDMRGAARSCSGRHPVLKVFVAAIPAQVKNPRFSPSIASLVSGRAAFADKEVDGASSYPGCDVEKQVGH